MEQAGLHSWYQGLNPTIVDLVGDFAGDELFIIEGDSLLRECFSSKHLDFSTGFQVLHATYLVEKFLQKLQQRRCVFEIVFFAQNAHICIPAGVDDDLHDRYLLAREAIIQHLNSVALQSSDGLRVKTFQSFESKTFEEHLVNSGVYLFMCHDGAYVGQKQKAFPKSGGDDDDDDDNSLSDSGSDSESESDNDEDSDEDHEFEQESQETESKSKLRGMIQWLSFHGYNVALIHSLEFRDTKVMAMVIQGSIETSQHTLTQEPHTPGPEVEKHRSTDESSVAAQAKALLEKAIHEQPGLTQRQCLLVVTLGTILLDNATFSTPSTTTVAALILHLVLLQDVKLEDRATKAPKLGDVAFFNLFLKVARNVIGSEDWEEAMNIHKLPCDLFDPVDGNLFFKVQASVEKYGVNRVLTPETRFQFNSLASLVGSLCGTKFECVEDEKTQKTAAAPWEERKPSQATASPESQGFTKVLPFHNAVFEDHLKPVHLETENSDFDDNTKAIRFTESTHWHSTKPLNPKKAPALTPKEVLRRHKLNQRFMAEMEKYAKSLSGSTVPETIVVGSSNNPPPKSQSGKGKPHSGPKGKAQTASDAPTSRELASAAVQRKAAEGEQKQVARWTRKCHEFATISDPLTRFKNVDEYLSGLPKDSRLVLEPEILAYLLDALVQILLAEHKNGKGGKKINILVGTHIWAIITRLMKLKQGISTGIVKYVEDVCQRLELPVVPLPTQSNQPLSFKPSAVSKTVDMTVGMTAVEFQLLLGGPLMERSIDSAPDPRTPDFDPDAWQRKVLDQIDAKKSAFVVAPTSAGKTFISFYAMRQILKEDHDGILVYVAPTKALVNQIAAEVLARFSKNFPAKATSKSVWAIHTRDYRINNPMGCQILITVPHILQMMLLAPSNAKAWTPRLRRIIYDEIHCIGQAEDGVVWEQLLLLSPCPIIALSATVGNPQEFESWLNRAQGTNGHDLKMIQHEHRYSDLRKYIYTPPQTFSFEGLSEPTGLSRLGLDEADGMTFIHPALSLVDRSKGLPADFSLEPRDCWTLWKAMHAVQTDQFPVDSSLNPSALFSGKVIRKKDIIEWQKPLKALLEAWMKNRQSPFEDLLRHLSQDRPLPAPGLGQVSAKTTPSTPDVPLRRNTDLLSTTLPLICSLHAQRALPALFFNYDRSVCEDLGHQLLNQLKEAEGKWKSENQAWKSKVQRWTTWKKNQENGAKKTVKATKKKGDDQMSRSDQMRESASMESSPLELFDPERPVERFSFADFTKLTPSEFAEYANILRWRGISEWLINALERGIGIHHAGMNRKYRQTCETLFRKGFLRVVIATGTLALGINMPCKTVIFAGDSIFLTALNFRQAAGRAGRRGFDVLGNVVFQEISTPKIHRLITSRLPDLNGHFPLSTSLVLRMLILQNGSGQAASAVKSINSILSNPRICLGGPEMKETVLHYLRFSIEYLRRNHLLDKTGAPLNFAGCISHLYYTENSSFAFHALLDSGYLQTLCKDINTKPKATLRSLMLVMAHLFGRTPLRLAILESYRAAEKRASSVVVLPPLPRKAAQVLNEHNNKALGIYTGYVSTFIEQNIRARDDRLPYSNIKCGGETPATQLGFSGPVSTPPRITSSFHALSGVRDKWDSISDLCETVRGNVWLEASVVPFVDISKESQPLNAYLYDFFKHGNVQQLEFANGIRRGDMWFLLNDFSMVLATLITSLENFLNPNELGDTEMLDIAGGGDVNELGQEEKFLETEDKEAPNAQSLVNRQQPAAQAAPVQKTTRARQTKDVAESWEDAMDGAEKADLAEASKPDPEEQRAQEMEHGDQARKSLILVHRAFQQLKSEFDVKFQAMWA